MADSTLEQRVAWLQQGLREIGRFCLELGNGHPPTDGETEPRTPPHHPPNQPAAPAAADDIRPLDEFLQDVQDLNPQERRQVVDAAIAMLSQIFVHLPLKRSMYAIDPLQRLRLLRERLAEEMAANTVDRSARGFHDEMIDVFHSLRDLHTNYLLPASYRGKTAFLPFLLQEYYEGTPRRRQYVVTRLLPGFTHPTFKIGVNVTHWNGIPIERAIEINAQREAGNNPDARHARGLEALTLRPMLLTAPPDEAWVIIGYRTEAGESLELRLKWQVTAANSTVSGIEPDDPTSLGNEVSLKMAFDAEAIAAQRAKKSLFFPEEIRKEERMAEVMASTAAAANVAVGHEWAAAEKQPCSRRAGLRQFKSAVQLGSIASAQAVISEAASASAKTDLADDPRTTSLLPDFLSFRTVQTASGTFGYIRIFSFMAFDANAFVAEFIRILELLPQTGLIIDVRGNGGGNILAGELLLQTLTSEPIRPQRFHFINTSGTARLCESVPTLSHWARSIKMSLQSSEVFSQGFPLTDPSAANKLGRRYPGKVVLIIDALCYSTTDIFAAGFQDHKIGPILGTSDCTGAGGANVWTFNAFAGALDLSPDLPKGVSFRSAIRRCTRVNDNEGLPLEDFGVTADERHYTTRRDVLHSNEDLIEHAASLLD
jgi:hypothetical protein